MKMWKLKINRLCTLLSCCLWSVLLSGCIPHEQPRIQFLPHMHRSQALRTYRGYSFFEDGGSARTAPEGTVPRDFYIYNGELNNSPQLKNPLPTSLAVVHRGQKVYNNACVVCHGSQGKGDGSIIPKFGFTPPNLAAGNARNMADGMIFHIITKGRGLMGSYASQVPAQDRWAVVHYIRALQKASNATAEEFQKFQEGR